MSEKRYKLSNGDGGTFSHNEDRIYNLLSGIDLVTLIDVFGLPEKITHSDHLSEWSVEIYDTVNEQYLDCTIMDKRYSNKPLIDQTDCCIDSVL
jgi:hypothetical protein